MALWNEDAFIGGHPALDFVNTVEDQDKRRDSSRISEWASFLGWAQVSYVFSEEQMNVLENEIQQTDISTLLRNIHDLRETAYAALSGIASGEKQTDDALQKLEEGIRTALRNSSLKLKENSYIWVPDMVNPNWVIDVLTLSIESLLRFHDISKLKECGRCSWMFLNQGRGRGRRWCNMKTCGNRAKSVSFRKRKQ
ncbi:Putative stress-induced transcription regulator [Amphritea atlantica]|uniref:Putative stress-induced transcription regulator n=1 Tax=Amphritea atlantica TaxID=355243 RepID=A0A1H9I4F5_9GAMM|nr:CGNR zinc finger domain-containing protein [Amphritea atlantica]SEQ69443.1 Putative stress-induced transcription regulator [Amphritea atlantica]